MGPHLSARGIQLGQQGRCCPFNGEALALWVKEIRSGLASPPDVPYAVCIFLRAECFDQFRCGQKVGGQVCERCPSGFLRAVIGRLAPDP